MGLLDALRGLTRPYDEDEDFFDDEEELFEDEELPVKSSSRAGANPFFGTDTPEYDAPEADDEPAQAPVSRPAFLPRRPREQEQRSTRMPPAQAGGNKIVFVKPERYEDTKMIYDHLRSRRIVLMSLDETNKEIASRILDFMAGAVYASGGKIARVSSATYIITPKDVDMMGSDMMDELENTSMFF